MRSFHAQGADYPSFLCDSVVLYIEVKFGRILDEISFELNCHTPRLRAKLYEANWSWSFFPFFGGLESDLSFLWIRGLFSVTRQVSYTLRVLSIEILFIVELAYSRVTFSMHFL